MADAKRIEFDRLPWVLRREVGEVGGRPHLHGLLWVRDATPSLNHFLKWKWERLGGGFARVHTYDPALAGADYIAKGLGIAGLSASGGGMSDGARKYEASKFDKATGIELSGGAWRLLRSVSGVVPDRRTCATSGG